MDDLFLRMKSATFFTSISDSGEEPQNVSLHGLEEAPVAERVKGDRDGLG